MTPNVRSLIGKLNKTCHRALEAAAGLCLSRTNYNIELEHWLFKLNEDPETDIAKILQHYEISSDRFAAGLTKVMDKLKTGNGRTPAMSPSILDAITAAWNVASIELNLTKVRSGALFLALADNSAFRMQLMQSLREIEKVRPEQFKNDFFTIVEGSREDQETTAEAAASGGARPGPGEPGAVAPGSKTPSLDQFTIDLTAKAKAGKIDPVLGRDREVRQIIDILTRRRQNNPILTGEAGVGKTAVVEGFALRIAAGDVPPQLRNVMLKTLDLGLLQAGAGVKGEFENRLRGVIDEVKGSPTPIILFIDEAHQMIGAGGSEGQGDAANLLKPALARGELRTIAATTWAEYKKYFEKDAALARRFQVVKVEEPTEDIAVTMMRGLIETMEKHHKVSVLDAAVEASVRLSARYITGRQLPDKCVSLLDTACARVAISQTATPGAVEDMRRQITLYETEKRVLTAEQAVGANHTDRLQELENKITSSKAELANLEGRWKSEKDLVTQIHEIRSKLRSLALGTKPEAAKATPAAAAAPPAPGAVPPAEPEKKLPDDPEKLKQMLDELNGKLSAMQGENPLLAVCVDEQTIAEVIEAWTGIPAGRMVADQILTVLNLKQSLCQRVIGQDHSMEAIARRIQTSRAKMDDPQKPIGVFMLVGPSGVGKTETAIALSELLYGGERNMITINMSEYQEAHTVSSLKGSPPGYVGYGEGGVLTEAVRRKPYSVVLLDEVEKAHSDVMELFFQVFDKGLLEDGEGREIDFKNTVILLTSNVATDMVMNLCADPALRPEPEALAQALRPEMEKVFPPALLGRLVITPYFPISDDVMKRIIRLKLGKIVKRVRENYNVPLTYGDELVDTVAKRCTEVSSGARNVDNILTNTLLPELAREFLARMADGKEFGAIHVGVTPENGFQYNFS